MFQEPIEYTAPDLVVRLVTQAEESRQLALIRTLESQEKDRRRYNSRRRADEPYYDPDLQAHFNDSVASDDRRLEKVHHPLEGKTLPDQQHAQDQRP
ncbi:hypothetical protein TNIN_356751 [Trichonephila inaurata madagascariensis]|uniref:Uncharacterized protein n=1 Tax=Trichonephila inaurata madagascariensis TaxID=2747483 RepID=A0A8X6M933_9ARAC|nr:hypothetical protein TNIN_356751 [Trichonephila inaurata madagascariensis]